MIINEVVLANSDKEIKENPHISKGHAQFHHQKQQILRDSNFNTKKLQG